MTGDGLIKSSMVQPVYFLFFFLDGVGLGKEEPQINPFAKAQMPNLERLLGEKLLADAAPIDNDFATLVALDANLGVSGLPQSATGQAALLTGLNVSAALGYHYGPKPNPAVAEYLQNGNLFSRLRDAGKKTSFLNAYPPGYFQAIQSGHRLYSAIPLAATGAGLPLLSVEDLKAGKALSADFTAQGWRERLGISDAPEISAATAGKRMAELSRESDFSFFEYWLSDYAGHHQDMNGAISLLETLDHVIGGLVDEWKNTQGLILLTSDHGNLEELNIRRHTANPVPALLIGPRALRRLFLDAAQQAAQGRTLDLTCIAPAVLNYFGIQ